MPGSHLRSPALPGTAAAGAAAWQLQALDALRGIAVLNVLLIHSAYWSRSVILQTRFHIVNDFIYAGQRGVQLFFLVSAFTLYLSADKRTRQRHPTRNFFLRRFFRIAPMFYVAALLTFVLWRSAFGPPVHAALGLLFLNGFSPTWINAASAVGCWSIATEVLFYALLPFFFRFVQTLRSAALLFFACAVYRAVYHYGFASAGRDATYYLYFSLPANLGVFALGILLYFVWRDVIAPYLRTPGGAAARNARQISLVLLLLAAGLYLEHPPRDMQFLLEGSVVLSLFMLSLLLHPWRLFVNRLTTFMGRISFSFYLLHFHAVHLLAPRLDLAGPLPAHTTPAIRIALMCLGVFCATTPLAWLAWRYIEQPGIHLGRTLIQALENRPTTRTFTPTFAEEQF